MSDIQTKKTTKATPKPKAATSCESCEFYDWDEDMECYVCTQHLDEDEMQQFLSRQTRSCPFYRFYDEYKTVQKQI